MRKTTSLFLSHTHMRAHNCGQHLLFKSWNTTAFASTISSIASGWQFFSVTCFVCRVKSEIMLEWTKLKLECDIIPHPHNISYTPILLSSFDQIDNIDTQRHVCWAGNPLNQSSNRVGLIIWLAFITKIYVLSQKWSN